MRRILHIIALAGCGTLVLPLMAAAHVVLAERTASPGAYYVATLRVPHGCDGSPTTGLKVQIPPDIVTARPMPKPGWQVEVTFEPLERPVMVESRELTRRVKEVVWNNGVLPDEQFDEFSISVKLPDRQGPVYFPVIQLCEAGKSEWVEIPREGQTARDLRFPAPAVVLSSPQP